MGVFKLIIKMAVLAVVIIFFFLTSINTVKNDLKSDMAAMKNDLESDMAAMKSDMLTKSDLIIAKREFIITVCVQTVLILSFATTKATKQQAQLFIFTTCLL